MQPVPFTFKEMSPEDEKLSFKSRFFFFRTGGRAATLTSRSHSGVNVKRRNLFEKPISAQHGLATQALSVEFPQCPLLLGPFFFLQETKQMTVPYACVSREIAATIVGFSALA